MILFGVAAKGVGPRDKREDDVRVAAMVGRVALARAPIWRYLTGISTRTDTP
jgi:hypothetical protein